MPRLPQILELWYPRDMQGCWGLRACLPAPASCIPEAGRAVPISPWNALRKPFWFIWMKRGRAGPAQDLFWWNWSLRSQRRFLRRLTFPESARTSTALQRVSPGQRASWPASRAPCGVYAHGSQPSLVFPAPPPASHPLPSSWSPFLAETQWKCSLETQLPIFGEAS